MRRKLLLVLIICSLTTLTGSAAPAQDATNNSNVDPALVLKGLQKARLLVNVTKGAHRELHSIGVGADKIDENLRQTVSEKMHVLPNLTLTPSSDDPGTTQMLVEVASDQETGVFSVVMAIQELVTLNREPHAQVWLTTWSMSEHPKSNEEIPIRNAVADLTDQFVDAYLAANEQPPRKPAH